VIEPVKLFDARPRLLAIIPKLRLVAAGLESFGLRIPTLEKLLPVVQVFQRIIRVRVIDNGFALTRHE
jgi:hypothetical protein